LNNRAMSYISKGYINKINTIFITFANKIFLKDNSVIHIIFNVFFTSFLLKLFNKLKHSYIKIYLAIFAIVKYICLFLKNLILFFKNIVIILMIIFTNILIFIRQLLTTKFWKVFISDCFVLFKKLPNIVRFVSASIIKIATHEMIIIIYNVFHTIKSVSSFMYYDLIKNIGLYIKNNVIKAISLLLILGNIFGSSLYFYNHQNVFVELSNKWKNSFGFIPLSNIVVNIVDNELFKPITFYSRSIMVEQDKNLYDILLDENVSYNDISDIINKINKLYSLKKMKSEITINLVIATSNEWEKNKIQRLSFPILEKRSDIIVEADKNYKYSAYIKDTNLHKYLMRRKIIIDNSVAESASKQNVPYSVIKEVTKALEWDVDFQREIHNNDALEIIFDCSYNQNDELSNCDNLLYVSLKGTNKNIAFYKYKGQYYEAGGKSIAKTLVKTPVDNARLSSSFGFRNHPVLGYTLLHKGIDFAAPYGTPIHASGNGVIEIRQYSATYGNFIKIRHNSHLSTLYAHMKGFNPKFKVKDRVNQRDIIGYLGGTGRVTGPHLHYEVYVNGKQVNPMTIKMPSDKKLSDGEMLNFMSHKSTLDSFMLRMPSKGKILSPVFQVVESIETPTIDTIKKELSYKKNNK
jgi:murein DD-endopeptidase MepM/ murein hydrolase activator NlpD